jgi:catalase
MTSAPKPEPPWAGLNRRRVLMGMAAVGGFLAVDLGAVLYSAGWIGGSDRLRQQTFIDAFRWVNGPQLGFRKNHAKGVAVAGYFDANGAAQQVCKAAVFRPGRYPVVGRFSLSGGDHALADNVTAARGLGLQFILPGGEQWRTAMLNLPVFPDNSPRGFYDRLVASKVSPATGKPDPKAMARFLAAHPETARAMSVIKAHPPTSGFADSSFHGLNTFYLVDHAAVRHPVRWSFFPISPPVLGKDGSSQNWMFDDLIRHVRRAPLRWRLSLTMAEPSDPLADATLPWPPDRRVIDAGTLTLNSVVSDGPGNARDVNFDPLVLPDGIEPSEDPLLSARSAVYAASYRLRTREPKGEPPVTVEEVAQ